MSHVSFDVVDTDGKNTGTKALAALKTLYDEQARRDAQMRAFAAEKLTDLSNDWADDDAAPITNEIFMDRISLSELSVSSEGNFTAYYDDDDMFYGHVVTVYGRIENGLDSADIEG